MTISLLTASKSARSEELFLPDDPVGRKALKGAWRIHQEVRRKLRSALESGDLEAFWATPDHTHERLATPALWGNQWKQIFHTGTFHWDAARPRPIRILIKEETFSEWLQGLHANPDPQSEAGKGNFIGAAKAVGEIAERQGVTLTKVDLAKVLNDAGKAVGKSPSETKMKEYWKALGRGARAGKGRRSKTKKAKYEKIETSLVEAAKIKLKGRTPQPIVVNENRSVETNLAEPTAAPNRLA